MFENLYKVMKKSMLGIVCLVGVVLCLPLLGGCEGASVLGRAITDSAADSASELDQEYGSNTFRHATKKRIRCSICGGDGYVNEDEATTSNPVGRCKICDGKGYTYEF